MVGSLTPSLPLCENCQRPAKYEWSLGAGGAAIACDQCRPADGESVREIDVAAVPQPRAAASVPLTVAQAAQRENVSERTIRRWLSELEADHGAWRVGTVWRIDPKALDQRRTRGPQSRPRRSPTQPPRKKSPNPLAWE
jgi:excisionase family DNA binding protein